MGMAQGWHRTLGMLPFYSSKEITESGFRFRKSIGFPIRGII